MLSRRRLRLGEARSLGGAAAPGKVGTGRLGGDTAWMDSGSIQMGYQIPYQPVAEILPLIALHSGHDTVDDGGNRDG